jgi:glyoxylase-like metal-dependent hydrolase (beta-lactamase superfamily II)
MKLFDTLYAFVWKSMTANNCNTYLIDGPTRILIDPGHRNLFDHVQEGLIDLNLGLEDIGLIVCTHAHPDHIEAVQLFKELSAMLTLHEKEWQLLKSMEQYISSAFGADLNSFAPDFLLKEGDLSVGELDFAVYHTPGHSPGSVCLYWPETKTLFTGDLIFKNGLGRTDLPGGDGKLLKESIKRLEALDVEWLLPGHGDVIQGKDAVKENFQHLEQFWFSYL